MTFQLPDAGAASVELASKAHKWWMDAAAREHINLSTFDPTAALPVRLAWAQNAGLDIGTLLSRYSTKLQHSTEAQVRHNVCFAPRCRLYTPPEFICIDEGEKGRRVMRNGLDRVRQILNQRMAHVLLVFKISRLLRVGYKGFQFVNEEVVEEGLRAISTSQGIDTNDEKTWKALMYLHGMMDDMLLDTIADHCRAELTSLFLEGYVTGPLSVGYTGEEVPGAPLTNRGLPRRKPVVVEVVKELICQHFEWIRKGMPISEGLRRWLAAGGPCDPRSTLKHMTYPAYRRLLSNRRLTGLWAFGRTRNRWSSKLDYTIQIEQPETEVKLYQCEELRIVEDEPFYEVQAILDQKKRGPRGPRKNRSIHLWDLITEDFFCAACSAGGNPIRFHTAGAGGNGMRCKRGIHCPCNTTVNRRDSFLSVNRALAEQIKRDGQLVMRTVESAIQLESSSGADLEQEKQQIERRVQTISAQLDDLYELTGQGSDKDRAELKAKIRSAQAQRTALLGEIARLEREATKSAETLTPERAQVILTDVEGLLEKAAAGSLGEEGVYRALAIFRSLVGRKIMVHVERRPARKRTNVRGVFHLHLIDTIREEAGQSVRSAQRVGETISVWLREPPRQDLLAPRVHQLIDAEGHSYRSAAKVLQAEGYNINSGVVWQIHHRYYEMIGQPMPKRPYNNGHPRKSI